MQRALSLPLLAVCLAAIAAGFRPPPARAEAPAQGCSGGRFVASVETIQRQNWIENSPTVYDQKITWLRLRWLGGLALSHASQGYLLSGEEALGRWSVVTVPPSLSLRMRLFGRHVFWPVRLPVLRETQACRDANGRLYVR